MIRQLLTESLLLAVVAGIAGVVMAYWTMDVIMAFVPPVDMPIDLGLRMDGTTLLFALGVSMVTGLVFGLAPALQASSSQTINALKEEGRSGSGGRTTGRLRSALVVAQVAVCLVLLVGATLVPAQLHRRAVAVARLRRRSHVVTASMDMFPSGYTGDRHREFQRRAHRSGRGAARRADRPRSDRACRSDSAATTRPASASTATCRARTKRS